MKTSYYLVAVAGLSAAAAVAYTRLANSGGSREVPSLPVPAEPASPPQVAAAPLPTIPLPPVEAPPDTPLVIPAGGPPPVPVPPVEAPLPIPTVPGSPSTLPVPPVEVPNVPDQVPAIPPVGLNPPATPPASEPPKLPPPIELPTLPASPTVPPSPTPPASPLPASPMTAPPALPSPTLPTPPVTPPPMTPLPKPPLTTPAAPMPPAPSAQLPAPTPLPTPEVNLAPSGKFVVLKGNKLIEGTATVAGDKVVVRQGALDRPFPKADVQFVGETRDDVYRFVLTKVPATDPAARLSVAKWCMVSGLREQALAEAREVLKLQPNNAAAADVARSLEESLKQFPPDGSTPTTRPLGGTLTTEPEPDVTAEGATAFASRAQPVLANQCMECHARPDYAGAFKLVRVTGFEVGQQSTRANLRAAAAQLKKDDPANSPLLTKALAMHGGMKQPAFANRQSGGFRVLEAWVFQAVAPVAPPMTPPTQPVIPPTPPVTPIPPAMTSALPAPAAVLPPAETKPVTVPPVLPTPPSIPPADPTSRTAPPMMPAIPAVPVIPAGGVPPAGGSQFGAGAKPAAPPTGPTGGDEFDPAAFNKNTPPRK